MLNTASDSPPASTLSALPGAISAALHRSIRFGMAPSPAARGPFFDVPATAILSNRGQPLLATVGGRYDARKASMSRVPMSSECARMTTADEARFRIDYPNSKPRAVKVVALDAPSEQVVKRLAQRSWQRATFFTARKFGSAPSGGEGWSMQAWLSDLAGRTKDLIDEVATADLMVMISSAGTSAEAAAVIAEACAVRKVMTTALIIGGAEKS